MLIREHVFTEKHGELFYFKTIYKKIRTDRENRGGVHPDFLYSKN